MKNVFILLLSIFIFQLAATGQTTFVRSGKVKIADTKLKVSNDGIPLYFAVLRYNDTIILDIEPIAKTWGSFNSNEGVQVGDYYNIETGGTSFTFDGKKVKPDDMIDLISNNKFKVDKGILQRNISFEYWEDSHGFMESYPKLPAYLKVSIEKLNLKATN